MTSELMWASVLHQHGGYEQLKFEQILRPVPARGEVLVRVRATSINHVDLLVRTGAPGLSAPLPFILGVDVAGEVAGIADDESYLRPGQRVILHPTVSCGRCEFCISGEQTLCRRLKVLGEERAGGYAQYIAVPVQNVVSIPEDFPFEQAACLPSVFGTAWRMVIVRGRLRAGEDVLVIGAGGGVASAAIQIANMAGARVFVTSSSEQKLQRAVELGASELINYRETDFDTEIWKRTGKRGVDMVVNDVGGYTWHKSFRCLRPGGRMVVCGATIDPKPETDARYIFMRQLEIIGSTGSSHQEFRDMLRHVWSGRLRPIIDRVMSLEEAPEAHSYVDSGRHFGKVVLVPPL